MSTLLSDPTVTEKDGPRVQRYSLSLPTRVEVKVDNKFSWNEVTRMEDVSAFGAGFILKRPVKRADCCFFRPRCRVSCVVTILWSRSITLGAWSVDVFRSPRSRALKHTRSALRSLARTRLLPSMKIRQNFLRYQVEMTAACGSLSKPRRILTKVTCRRFLGDKRDSLSRRRLLSSF